MKRHLLLAMLCIVGALNVSAQEDVTDQYLTNANLATQNSGWTQSGYTAWVTTSAVPVVEFWNWSNQFSFSQTVTLPAGNYRIAVNSFYRESWGGNGTNNNMAWIYAGAKTQNVVALNSMNDLSGYAGGNDLERAASAFKQGKFSNEFDFELSEQSSIELGFKGTCPNGGWCILGPVKLYKYSLEDYLVDYRAKVAEAQVFNEADMFPNAWAALQAAIVDESTFTLASEITAAIQTLNNAINVATASVTLKSGVSTKLDHMRELTEATNFYTAAAYSEYYLQWKEKYDAGTITETEAQGLQDPFVVTNWREAVTVDNFLLSAWDTEPDFPEGVPYYINTWSTEGDNDGSNFHVPFFEYFVGEGSSLGARTLQATATGLIPGQLYSVTIWARLRTSGDGQTIAPGSITMQVGDGTAVSLTTGTQVGSSRFYLDNFQASGKADSEGVLTLKLIVSEGSNVHWLSFKNAKYEELDDERIPYAEQLAALVAQAHSLATTLAVPDGVITALNAAATPYDDYTYESLPTVAAFQEAIAAVQAAITGAQSVEAAYAAYLKLKPYADALLAVANDNSEANAALAGAINTAETNIQTVANGEEAAAVNTALRNAMDTYVATANPVGEGAQFDLTYMLTNPNLNPIPYAWGVHPDGWYTDQSDGNFQLMENNEMGPGGEHFIEYWSENPKTEGFVLYQKVTIPVGTYKMTGRVGLQQNVNGTTANMTFSANETDGTQIAVGTLSDQEVEFINNAEQEVKIGLKAHDGNCYRWIGINDIHMYKIASDNTEFDIITSATNATVAVTVEGAESDKAKKLDGVTFTITPDEGCVIDSYTVTYTEEGSVITITPTLVSENTYTFQMPAADVTITVVASIDKSALQLAIAGAQAFDSTTVPSQVAALLTTALNDAIAVNNNVDATATEVANATNTLNFTLLDVQNFVAPYKAYLELKEYADYNVAAANDNATANTTFAAAIETAETAIAAATTADAANNVNEALRTAMDTYVATANPVGAGKFWLTYQLTNPDLTDLPSWQPCDGWSTEQPDGNSQVMNNDAATSEDGTKTKFYEYWSHYAKTNGLFTLYQSVNLPKGTYQMSCYAFAKQQDGETGKDPKEGVFFYANDTQGSVVSTDRLSYKEVEFVNSESQDVKIGLKAIDPNTYNWMGIGYVELYKVPAKNYIIDPDAPMIDDDDYVGYDYALEKAGTVTLVRSLGVQYNAVVLPFSMTQQEVENTFGQDSKVYIVSDYNSEIDNLSFEERDGLQANQPCLIKATEAGDGEYVIEGRTLVPCDTPNPVYAPTANVKMTGVYQDQFVLPENSIYIKGGNFVYAPADKQSWVLTTRAYVTIEGWTGSADGIKVLNVTFGDGDATGIAVIDGDGINILTGKVYDLSGREVKTPSKGVYIIDGKKVFIK